MPILTEPYRRRVELAANDVAVKEDGWVFDEWQLALKLYVIERIRIAGVWRAGPVVPVPLKGPRSRLSELSSLLAVNGALFSAPLAKVNAPLQRRGGRSTSRSRRARRCIVSS